MLLFVLLGLLSSSSLLGFEGWYGHLKQGLDLKRAIQTEKGIENQIWNRMTQNDDE